MLTRWRRRGRTTTQGTYTLVGRLLGFALNTLLLAGIPLVTLPIAIDISGISLWYSVAIGQAVGSLAGTIISFGWPVTGPTAVAARTPFDRGRYYFESLKIRLHLVAPVTVAAGWVTLAMAADGLSALLALISGISVALSATWYFVGSGQAVKVVFLDTMPRLASSAAGIALSLMLRSITPFLIFQTVGSLLATVQSTFRISKDTGTSWKATPYPSLRATVHVLRGQLGGFGTAAAAAVYVSLPLPLFGLVNPYAAGLFAAAQRVQKFVATLARALTQVMQGWVPAGGPERLAKRVKVALLFSSVVAGILGGGVTLCSPMAVTWLSAGAFHIDGLVATLLGIVTASIVISQSCGLACLIALGRSAVVFRSTLCGAVAGTALVPLAGSWWGLDGAWFATGTAELTVTVIQLIGVRKALYASASGTMQLRDEIYERNK